MIVVPLMRVAGMVLVLGFLTGCQGDAATRPDPAPTAPDTLPRIEGTWRRGPDLPIGLYRPGVHVHAGRLYVVGGATVAFGTDSGTTDALWSIAPGERSWRRGPDYPVDGMRIALFSRGDTLFGVGGQRFPGGRWDRLFRLTRSADTWERLPFLDGPVGQLEAVHSDGRYFFLEQEIDAGLWEFLPDTREWRTRAHLPLGRSFVSFRPVGRRILAVYGQTSGGITPGFIDRYDPVGDRWTTEGVGYASRRDPGVAALGGRLYLVGGTATGIEAKVDLFVYDPETATWYRGPDLPEPRAGLVGRRVGDELWFLSGRGRRPSELVRTVWIFRPS